MECWGVKVEQESYMLSITKHSTEQFSLKDIKTLNTEIFIRFNFNYGRRL